MILLVLIDINYDLFNNRIDNQSIIIYICYYSFNLIFKKSINIHTGFWQSHKSYRWIIINLGKVNVKYILYNI